MSKVVTFGEIMLRLAPENYLRLVQSEKLEATFGGAEANISVSLANFGVDTAFVSKLPAHEIGQMAVNSLRKFGVDTSILFAVAIESAFITTKRARTKDLVMLSTIGHIRQSLLKCQANLTGIIYLTALVGFTLRV